MNTTIAESPLEENVDGLLRSFFKREMPAPWPEAMIPAPVSRGGGPRFWIRYSRLVLAASLALIFFGYLILAGMFPVEPEPGLTINQHRTIGSKPGLKQHMPAPRGGAEHIRTNNENQK